MKTFNFGSRISLTSICICKHTSIGHELNSLRSRISDLTTSHFHSHLQAYINWTLAEFNLWYKFGSINRTLIVLPCTWASGLQPTQNHTGPFLRTPLSHGTRSHDVLTGVRRMGDGVLTGVRMGPRRRSRGGEKMLKKIQKKIGRAGHGGIRTQSENPKFIYHRHHIDTHAHTERVTALEC